jgi:hypothetical protein
VSAVDENVETGGYVTGDEDVTESMMLRAPAEPIRPANTTIATVRAIAWREIERSCGFCETRFVRGAATCDLLLPDATAGHADSELLWTREKIGVGANCPYPPPGYWCFAPKTGTIPGGGR